MVNRERKEIKRYGNAKQLLKKVLWLSDYTLEDLCVLLQVSESKLLGVLYGREELSKEELKRAVDLYLFCHRLQSEEYKGMGES